MNIIQMPKRKVVNLKEQEQVPKIALRAAFNT
jgi:hypothetical protein